MADHSYPVFPNPSNSDLVGEALQAWKLVRSIVAASAARDSRGEDSEALAAIAVLDESIPELAQQLEQAEQRNRDLEWRLKMANPAALTPDEGADPGGR